MNKKIVNVRTGKLPPVRLDGTLPGLADADAGNRASRRLFAKLAKNPEHQERVRKAREVMHNLSLKRRKQVAKQQHEAHKRALLRGSKLALKKHKRTAGMATLVNHHKGCLA